MAAMFIACIWFGCRINPKLDPALGADERTQITAAEKRRLLWAVALPLGIFVVMMGPFVLGYARLVESSVIGAPLYLPLVAAPGFHLIWHGVPYTITCQIACTTPPFGCNLFLMKAMAPPEFPCAASMSRFCCFSGS